MGGCLNKQDQVTPVDHHKQVLEDEGGPVKKRSCTDVFWLVFMSLFFVVLLGLLIHCTAQADIYRVINGYDNCANICGRKTPSETLPEFACKGADMTDKKYLLIKEAGNLIVNRKNINKECVADCSVYPDFVTFLNRCLPKKTVEVVNKFYSRTGLMDFFHEVAEDIDLVWPELLYSTLTPLCLSIILLGLLQFVASFIVWLIMVGSILLSIITTILLWINWSNSKMDSTSNVEQRKSTTYLVYAIVATVITVVLALVLLFMRKKIRLVSQLFYEAGKAASRMPMLFGLPVLTVITILGAIAAWFFVTIVVESSGYLTANSPNFYYKKDIAMKITRWWNLFGILWFMRFCTDCQHMVTAGAVAHWFFTRNKETLKSPISRSFSTLMRYHVGSVAFGSLLIAIFQALRALFLWAQSKLKKYEGKYSETITWLCSGCLYCLQNFLAFVTRNTYIEIAIYGDNFFNGGRQAFKMLTSNALSVMAINSIGDFVLFLGKMLIVIASTLVATYILKDKEGLQHLWVFLALIFVFSYCIAHCFLSVYEMIIDTIFLCFCEDCEINDGISKPYYMSRGLMEFIQNSKKELAVGDRGVVS